ncbi:MAG: uncharacterized protein KVP18_002814 [Porospora cf. gigantea A]|uniref:uncharacterized protein n=1 Tax=Porospora cf. gigantea A TaxID=2853593 RepID=UPI0035598C8F|nr:MAG: hypothetical protein KVP18_002814 [Porospora cf. gigantea A]
MTAVPGQSTTTAASWSETRGNLLVVWSSRGRYWIRSRPGQVNETRVHYVGSEAPILTSVDMPAEIDALYKHVKVGNWKAATPLADKIVLAIDSQLQ